MKNPFSESLKEECIETSLALNNGVVGESPLCSESNKSRRDPAIGITN